jgi:hypothetical protein
MSSSTLRPALIEPEALQRRVPPLPAFSTPLVSQQTAQAAQSRPTSNARAAVRTRRLELPAWSRASAEDRLTHYLFRYPAKFHPPVVRQLIADYTAVGDLVYDPFNGSGTLLVEALVSSRNALGSDVDPLAVFVSKVKTKPVRESVLRADLAKVAVALAPHRRSGADYERLQFVDVSPEELVEDVSGRWVPPIPNIEHWFRRYVIADLARILTELEGAQISSSSRQFFRLVFASIIRTTSNADPIPVSGLEVTSHMKRLDAEGRRIDPFELFERAAARAIVAIASMNEAASGGVRAATVLADATRLPSAIRRRDIAAVITSPPYHGAVDYYRRHQLEMFWLGLVADQRQRLELLQQYIGRTKVAARHPLVRADVELPDTEAALEAQMRAVDASRADAFRHYCVAMGRVFGQLGKTLRPHAPAMFVVGHSVWRDTALNISDLFAELSRPYFKLEEVLDYPVKNRYMSYARRNGASIDHEYVLVFRRTKSET